MAMAVQICNCVKKSLNCKFKAHDFYNFNYVSISLKVKKKKYSKVRGIWRVGCNCVMFSEVFRLDLSKKMFDQRLSGSDPSAEIYRGYGF